MDFITLGFQRVNTVLLSLSLLLVVQGGIREAGSPIIFDLGRGIKSSRGLLSQSVLNISGGDADTGYFYANIKIGSPPQEFQLILDTGSSLLYVPCSNCGSNCGHHTNPYFQPSKSSSFKRLDCQSELCVNQWNTCRAGKCHYRIEYAEQSSTRGQIAQDVVHLPGLDPVAIAFGCEDEERGLIRGQVADGILGLSAGDIGLVTQLAQHGQVPDVLAICISGEAAEAGQGIFVVGKPALPPGTPALRYTDLLPSTAMYTVHLNDLTLGGASVSEDKVQYNHGIGTVVDTGTTFLYLPMRIYDDFAHLLERTAGAHLSQKTKDFEEGTDCYHAAFREDQLADVLPPLSFHFQGSILTVPAENYAYLVGSKLCLGVYPQNKGGVILGSSTLRNVLAVLDRERSRFGFVPQVSCKAVKEATRAGTKHCGPGDTLNRKGVCQPAHAAGTDPPMHIREVRGKIRDRDRGVGDKGH